MAAPWDVERYVEGTRSGDRAAVARTITLMESSRPDHREVAREVLRALLPHTGGAQRVGITGVPGVGKSTFIDQLGVNLTAAGHRVAVLAVDPSSSRTGGSILGDKTRMSRLAVDPAAFVRPSPTGRTLGGVTSVTRETMLVCEAAGYDVVLVETVGVGQSETVVADMVDMFCVLMLPGAGDELQGIKKGILELADLVVVNKADGDNVNRARLAAAELKRALHLLVPASPNWSPPVLIAQKANSTACKVLRPQSRSAFWPECACLKAKRLGVAALNAASSVALRPALKAAPFPAAAAEVRMPSMSGTVSFCRSCGAPPVPLSE